MNPPSSRLAVVAAGGTGGHLFPAEALARELAERGWRIVLATDARGAQYAEPFPTEERLAVRRRPNSSSPAQRGRKRSPFPVARRSANLPA